MVARRRLLCLLVASLPFAAYAQMSFIESSNPAGLHNNITQTYGLSVGDINGDGLPDVFANNHAMRNSILRNDPLSPGVFREVHREVDAEGFWESRVAPGNPVRAWEDTHGAAWIDYDNDGDQDLLVTTGVCCDPQFFVNDAGLLYQRSVQLGFGNNADREGRASLWYDSNGDGLLEMSFITSFTGKWMDQVGGRFVEDTTTNFNCSRSLYGVQADLVGDPNLEMICVAPGGPFARVWDVSTRPFRGATTALPVVVDVTDVVLGDFDGNLRTDLLLLKGALRPSELVSFARPEQGRWGIEALIVSKGRGFSGLNLYPEAKPGFPAGGPYELFRNRGWARNWLQIDLVGTQSNRDAIGARVYVYAGGVRQFRQQDGGFHRWSQNSKRLHFGLKTNSRADVTVHWPSGLVETFPNVTSKRIYRITEGSGIQAI